MEKSYFTIFAFCKKSNFESRKKISSLEKQNLRSHLNNPHSPFQLKGCPSRFPVIQALPSPMDLHWFIGLDCGTGKGSASPPLESPQRILVVILSHSHGPKICLMAHRDDDLVSPLFPKGFSSISRVVALFPIKTNSQACPPPPPRAGWR